MSSPASDQLADLFPLFVGEAVSPRKVAATTTRYTIFLCVAKTVIFSVDVIALESSSGSCRFPAKMLSTIKAVLVFRECDELVITKEVSASLFGVS